MVNRGIFAIMKKHDTKRKPLQAFDTDELGHRLRKLRLDSGLSLNALAGRVKVTKGYLSRLECGRAKPSARMIERIAKAVKADAAPLYVLAGYIPEDVKQILYFHPEEAPAMLRETFTPYGRQPQGARRSKTMPRLATPSPKAPPVGAQRKNLYELIGGDCFEWLDRRAANSIHAVVTDPPYGLKEYTEREKSKLRRGRGGVWRIPPTLDGCIRLPVPRFTVLTDHDKLKLRNFFLRWATLLFRVLVPGGHIFIATNPLVSQLLYWALIEAGFEKRGEIIRLVQTLRGGDRPKNAHKEFHDVTVMPRSCWEPWGLFRKPCEGRVQDNLRKWKTGGLRRVSEEKPFSDVIKSAPTRTRERDIAPHPSLKPQAFMRQVVRAALPLGEGILLDPFMGAGSTIAAACALGYQSIGIESDPEYFKMAVDGIPRLASLLPNGNGVMTRTFEGREDQQILFRV